ncbi:hypothetical protein [Streptomyces lavenduligriseus]|uniref:Uncharacterized protein n=1 Tax=Streptomyces lavenduligriseus TaxID=67315 RepID=A0ABT0NML0_9ACTN|nr:hypothetical protein [Streptomyces lavenduligriseus]MCL3992092.1 hypothetical protein [Streptomyces lavenduligriseus]
MPRETGRTAEVFRITPAFGDRYKGLLVDALSLMRWEMDGSVNPLPEALDAEWHGNPGGTVSDYPSGHAVVPVFSRRLAEETFPRFQGFGHCIPVHVPDARTGDYRAYVPSVVADCLDRKASSSPSAVGEIEHAEFIPERLPLDVPCFRLTDNRTYVYWNGWAARLIQSVAAPENVELRLVWSTEPGAVRHPRPMGF